MSSDEQRSFYHYDPSEAAAGVFAVLFALSFLHATWKIFRRRSWVWLVFLFAVGMEVVGFAARVVSARDTTARNPYIISFLMILLAPVFMAGVIYVLFGRIVFWVMPPEARTMKNLWVPARFVTLIFVAFDVLSILLQAIAGVVITSVDDNTEDPQSRLDLGRALGLIGVAVQLGGFGLFTIIAVRFHFVSRKADPNFARYNMETFGINKSWQKLLYAINFSCLMILIRSCFRMAEFAEGPDGVLYSAEWYIYVLDITPVAIAALLYNLYFPGNYLKHLGFRLPKEFRSLPKDAEAMAMSPWNQRSNASASEAPLADPALSQQDGQQQTQQYGQTYEHPQYAQPTLAPQNQGQQWR
jgi:hypothetical protein